MTDNEKFCELGRAVIETEAAAVLALSTRIDHHFAKACELILKCPRRIVVIGMGKSGHIGGKIAATFASTGTPAFFVHPGEASHGDLGMITRKDVVIAISNSGETQEIITILPLIKRLGIKLIVLTGQSQSTLAQAATVTLDVSITTEACPLGLVPTASTTATMAMGDALAVALLEARGFTAEDFARAHPGGSLGKRLLLRIEDVMRKGNAIPITKLDAKIHEALIEMTQKSLGMTAIVNDQGTLVSVFTDGDLRRNFENRVDIHTTPIHDVISDGCRRISPQALAVEALEVMETHKITSLMVADDENRPIGVVHMHDLLSAGVAI